MSFYKDNHRTLNGEWITHELATFSHRVCPFDVSLMCQDGSVEFHKFILGPQSKFLHTLLTVHDGAMGEGESISIILPDFEGNEARALFELLYKGSVSASSDDLITRLDDLTKILNLKPLAVTIVGTENDDHDDDDGFDSVEELFHGKAQFDTEETVCESPATDGDVIQPFGYFSDSNTSMTDGLTAEKYDPLISVSNEVFNTPIDEAAALQLINELYRNDGDAEHILDRFFKNLPDDITFSRSHFEELTLALRTPQNCGEPNCEAKNFQKEADFSNHMKEVHGIEKSFKCPHCKNSYKFKNSLKDHLFSHQPTFNFACRICHKTFKNRELCQSHEKLHGDRQYKCKDCDAAFKQRHVLFQHRQLRHGPKRFLCDLCDKRFGTKQTLNNHKLMHTGETPFYCQACDVKFRRKHHLKIHVQTFSHATRIMELKSRGIKVPHEIDVREEDFTQREIFACDICPERKQFLSLYHLQKHKQSQAHLNQMMRHQLSTSEAVSVTQDFSIGLVDDILGGSSVISTSESTVMVDDHEIFILSEDIT